MDKARYAGEKAAYDLKVTADADEKKKAKKNAPKKNLSAYLLFGADMRETIKMENRDIKPTEVMKELGTSTTLCHDMMAFPPPPHSVSTDMHS